jgi:hypothetical protein
MILQKHTFISYRKKPVFSLDSNDNLRLSLNRSSIHIVELDKNEMLFKGQ